MDGNKVSVPTPPYEYRVGPAEREGGWFIVKRRATENPGASEIVASVFGESRANWIADALVQRDLEIQDPQRG